MASTCYAQIPNGNTLIKIHNINLLSDTNTINNPAIGNLVFAVDKETTYIYNGTGWVVWYKKVLYIDSLLQLIATSPQVTCCP